MDIVRKEDPGSFTVRIYSLIESLSVVIAGSKELQKMKDQSKRLD